jgi:tetratricopeptide (TPR) repeat protein
LHREATTHKKVNWDAAVACLQEAANLMRQHDSPHIIESWTRLPVFLQQAGRYDEAIQEFERLLSEVKPRVAKEMALSRSSPSVVKGFTHLSYSKIYDKMRLASQRQKLPNKAHEYQHLSEQHKLVYEELMRIAEMEGRSLD